MELIFGPSGVLNRAKGLTFDDVLLVPSHCQIDSRKTPDISTKLTKRFHLKTPMISANMDTITEYEMALAMAKLGGLGIVHRFMSIEEQVKQIKKLKLAFKETGLSGPIAASIGVKEEGQLRASALADVGVDILTIDIAHGDSVMMFETITYVKKNFPHIDVIAGNIATDTGTKGLVDAGADAVKVGIGPGSMCTTRIITGTGVPQLTAIALSLSYAKKHGIPVIADGGIKNSGDIVKALSVGASAVMLGSLLAGAMETPGEVKSGKKKYRGMASKDAQVSWRGELPEGMAAEGEDTFVACKGSVNNIIAELSGGLKSGMTYANAINLGELTERAKFMEMSPAGLYESRPHGVQIF